MQNVKLISIFLSILLIFLISCKSVDAMKGTGLVSSLKDSASEILTKKLIQSKQKKTTARNVNSSLIIETGIIITVPRVNHVSSDEVWHENVVNISLTLEDDQGHSIDTKKVKLKHLEVENSKGEIFPSIKFKVAKGLTNTNLRAAKGITLNKTSYEDDPMQYLYKFSFQPSVDIPEDTNIVCTFEIQDQKGTFEIVQKITVHKGLDKKSTRLDRSSVESHEVWKNAIVKSTLIFKSNSEYFIDVDLLRLKSVIATGSKESFKASIGYDSSSLTSIPSKEGLLSFGKPHQFSIQTVGDELPAGTDIIYNFEAYPFPDNKALKLDKKINVKKGLSQKNSFLKKISTQTDNDEKNSTIHLMLTLKDNALTPSPFDLGKVQGRIKLKKVNIKGTASKLEIHAANGQGNSFVTLGPSGIELKKDPDAISMYPFKIKWIKKSFTRNTEKMTFEFEINLKGKTLTLTKELKD